MINYYKYLPTSPEDEKWGMHVLNAGCNRICKHVDYPAHGHPAHHYFNWSTGRVLDEYQIIYIPAGNGIFESSNCDQLQVKEGTIIFYSLESGTASSLIRKPDGMNFGLGLKV